MSWNYRVIEMDVKSPDDPWFELCETYYHADGSLSYCHASVCGEGVEEIAQALEWMKAALSTPVLKESEIGGVREMSDKSSESV